MRKDWAPDEVFWANDSRFALIRTKTLGHSSTYVENRLPSSAANPYIVAAATIAAGIDGIKNKLELPKEMERIGSPIVGTLEEALNDLEKDKVLVEALGELFVEWFLRLKREVEIKELKDSDVLKNACEVDPETGKVNDFGMKMEQDMYYLFT